MRSYLSNHWPSQLDNQRTIPADSDDKDLLLAYHAILPSWWEVAATSLFKPLSWAFVPTSISLQWPTESFMCVRAYDSHCRSVRPPGRTVTLGLLNDMGYLQVRYIWLYLFFLSNDGLITNRSTSTYQQFRNFLYNELQMIWALAETCIAYCIISSLLPR